MRIVCTLIVLFYLFGCRTTQNRGVSSSPFSASCHQSGCAAPPKGCHYKGLPAEDSDGCPVGCGALVCGTETTNSCQAAPQCMPLEPGCTRKLAIDGEGCVVGCGTIACTATDLGNCANPPQLLSCCAAMIPACQDCKVNNNKLLAEWQQRCGNWDKIDCNKPFVEAVCCVSEQISCTKCRVVAGLEREAYDSKCNQTAQ